jgi:sodium transport system permease protein
MQEYLANGRLSRLCLKELRESLRDRRTIITLIMMPILVYPLLSMALQRLLIGAAGSNTKSSPEYVIGVQDEATAKVIGSALRETQRAASSGIRSSIDIRRPKRDSVPGLPESTSTDPIDLRDTSQSAGQVFDSNVSNILPSTGDAAFSIVIPEGIRVSESLQSGDLDLAVLSATLNRTSLPGGGSFPAFDFQLEFRDGDPRSEAAMLEFRKAMQLVNDFQFASLSQGKIPPSVQLVSSAVGMRADPMASIAGIIPLVLILMTITGAVYPAIDLTAGERERGTMEAMIATPAPRFVLLLSKYVAVVTVAVLTACANLFASWLTLSMGGLGRALLGEKGFSFLALIQILPLLVIFAAFFSAILLAMCSFARSFKEAQSYLIPVMLVSLAPALVTLMPNIQFSTLLGIVPLVNILLLSRDIMTGTPSALPAFAAVLSTLLYAGAALVIASKLFGAESATAGSQETWSELVRRPKRLRSRPDISELAIYLALLFPIFFVATNLAGTWKLDISSMLMVNAVMLLILFLLLPALYAWYRRLQFGKTFLLSIHGDAPGGALVRGLRFLGVIGSVALLAGGLWIVAYEALKVLSDLGFGTLNLERTAGLEEAKAQFLKIPFGMILVATAIVPAIAEEFFFRGFVLSALRTRLSASRAVLYSAILFGLFHVINGSMLSLERFVPTTILGLALGYLAVRTNALWPGILLHAIHNGLLFWLTRFSQSELAQWFGSDQEHFPIVWVVASAISIGLGLTLLFVSTLKRSDEISA